MTPPRLARTLLDNTPQRLRAWRDVLAPDRAPVPAGWFTDAEDAAFDATFAGDDPGRIDDATWRDLEGRAPLQRLAGDAGIHARQWLFHRLRRGADIAGRGARRPGSATTAMPSACWPTPNAPACNCAVRTPTSPASCSATRPRACQGGCAPCAGPRACGSRRRWRCCWATSARPWRWGSPGWPSSAAWRSASTPARKPGSASAAR